PPSRTPTIAASTPAVSSGQGQTRGGRAELALDFRRTGLAYRRMTAWLRCLSAGPLSPGAACKAGMWKKIDIACKCNGLRLVYWHFPVATQVILKFEEYLDMGLSGLGTSSVHRWRWVLYVVLALFGGSLTFVG